MASYIKSKIWGRFPSPFGVLFFFIWKNRYIYLYKSKRVSVSFRSSILFYKLGSVGIVAKQLFPSPFGVLFFFIFSTNLYFLYLFYSVSVSFRSSILFYEMLNWLLSWLLSFPSPFGVLFFFIVIPTIYENNLKIICFRLLSEFYSFLSATESKYSIFFKSFRLLSEFYSFLLNLTLLKSTFWKNVSVSFRSSILFYEE